LRKRVRMKRATKESTQVSLETKKIANLTMKEVMKIMEKY